MKGFVIKKKKEKKSKIIRVYNIEIVIKMKGHIPDAN